MQQIRRSFSSIIARVSLATAALAGGGVAMAANISWSGGIASPGYQVVVTQAPPVVVVQPAVVVRQPRMRVQQPVVHVQQPRMRVHRPVVTHVVQPQVIYTRAPVFTHGQGHRAEDVRDIGRHGYQRKNRHKPRYYRYDRHDRHGHPPGYDGNWGNN